MGEGTKAKVEEEHTERSCGSSWNDKIQPAGDGFCSAPRWRIFLKVSPNLLIPPSRAVLRVREGSWFLRERPQPLCGQRRTRNDRGEKDGWCLGGKTHQPSHFEFGPRSHPTTKQATAGKRLAPPPAPQVLIFLRNNFGWKPAEGVRAPSLSRAGP